MSNRFRFSSAGLEEAEAFDRYRDLYAGGSDVTRGEGRFHADVVAWRLDRLLLFDRRLGGVIHTRRDRVASDGFDHVVLTLVQDGGLDVSVDGGDEFAAGAGDIVLFDARQPWRTVARSAHLITISVARDVVEAALGRADDLHGRVLVAPDNHVLADYLVSLARRAPQLAPERLPSLSRAFVDILASATPRTVAKAAAEKIRLDFLRREAVDRYLADRLADREVSASTISAATGISRSSLYRLFERHGGVVSYIQSQRLDAIRTVLDDGAEGSLTQLAHAHGFADENHMSRLFSEVYGAPPGAYRQQSRATLAPGDPSLASRRWSAWMGDLK